MNHVYGEGTLVVPEPVIAEGPLVPGTDGEKMSKSRGNTLPLFASEKALRKMVMKIKTSSESLEEPKPSAGTTVYELLLQVSPAAAPDLAKKLAAGGFGWGDAKQVLFEAIEAELGGKRDHYEALRADESGLDAVLAAGAERAQQRARETMRRVRSAIGIAPPT